MSEEEALRLRDSLQERIRIGETIFPRGGEK
jgi:hypothetical protein